MLRQILEDREDVIVGRWLDRVLAAYPAEGAAAFKRGRDPFGNPVGHTTREAIRALYGALTADEPTPEALTALSDLLRVRAVQQMPASVAVGFILELKAVVRAELSAWWSSELDAGLRELEDRIDRLALDAFDIYVGFRDELAHLKVREARRHVAWIVERLNGGETPTADDGSAMGNAGEAEADPFSGLRLPVLNQAGVGRPPREEARP